jgi:putative colanic acid biosynthesis UDP-glucose lipid carrier transferase
MAGMPIRNSASVTSLLVQLFDFLAIGIGGWLAFQFRFSVADEWAVPRPEERMLVLGMAMMATLFFSKVYRMWPGGALAAMVGRVTLGWLMAWVAMVLFLVLTKTSGNFSRTWLVTWLLFTTGTLWLGRVTTFLLMAQMRRAGYHHKRLLLVGDTSLMTTVQNRVNGATWSGYDIVHQVSLSDCQNLKHLDESLRPDEIWIGLRMADHNHLDGIMLSLAHSVANIRVLPDLMMYQMLNHGMSVTLGIPMVDMSVSPMFGGHKAVKMLFDYTTATLILMLISPLLLLIGLAVKISSEGPVLFKQKRHGWNGDEITVYKFRSMCVHQETAGSVTQAKKEDSRITPIGRFLRKTSLDELPQFINVLQGRMSVVGPRPHALAHNHEYTKLIPYYGLRHKVKPGITGWAQICGFRGETDTLDKMEGRIKHDLYYLEHWSLWLDLKIVFLTPLATIQNKNVY